MLTVNSVAGAELGKTKITVSPRKFVASNKYKYKVQQNDFTALPVLGDDLSDWTTWDGTSEISATNGYYIAVAETEADFSCEKVGKTRVQSLLATSTAGSYNSETGVWTDGETTFTLTQQTANNVKVNGTLPYEDADAILGLPAGNRFSVKIENNSIITKNDLPSGTIVKVTNTGAESGYNTYDKNAFEDDGSLIVVINIANKNIPIEVKITWITGIETTYTYNLKDVILEEAPEPEPEPTPTPEPEPEPVPVEDYTEPNEFGGNTVNITDEYPTETEQNEAGGNTVIIGGNDGE